MIRARFRVSRKKICIILHEAEVYRSACSLTLAVLTRAPRRRRRRHGDVAYNRHFSDYHRDDVYLSLSLSLSLFTPLPPPLHSHCFPEFRRCLACPAKETLSLPFVRSRGSSFEPLSRRGRGGTEVR